MTGPTVSRWSGERGQEVAHAHQNAAAPAGPLSMTPTSLNASHEQGPASGSASLAALSLPRGLVIWICAACLLNLLWIQLNAAPPRSWDDAEYLADSVSTYQPLARGDLAGFVRAASRPARGVHPPMTKLVPIPMYVLLGFGTRPALYGFTALIPVFCLYVFLLGTLVCRSRDAAVLAVVVTCCFPVTFGLWRLAMAEFGLAVATIAAQYHVFRAAEARGEGLRHAILAGAFIGWGLLWKVSFPVFVAGPLCYFIFRTLARSSGPVPPLALRRLLLIGCVALIVAGPFYFLRGRELWGFVLFNSTPSASLEQFSLGPILSPATVLNYWVALVNIGTSGYFFIVGAGLTLAQIFRRRWPAPLPATWFLASCALVPLIFFSFQYLKEPRHLFPAFPVVGVLIALLLEDSLATIGRNVRLLLTAALLAFPAYQFALLSFDIPWVPSRDIRLGRLLLAPADRESLPVRPARPTAWPVGDIVGLLRHSGGNIGGRPLRVRVAGHIPFLDGPVLNYESLLRYGQPLAYNLLGDRSLHPTWWDFVVVLSGPLELAYEYREPVLGSMLEAQRLPFTAIGNVPLPGRREAVIYRANAAAHPPVTVIGDNLVTARNRHGKSLFPVSKEEWQLPGGGRGTAGVTRDQMPMEFQYVYVPGTTRLLNWTVVVNPQTHCESSGYTVTVFDLHSRRGPAHQASRTFTLRRAQEQESASLGMEPFRNRIVTIGFLPLPGRNPPQSCIGWTEVSLAD
jgi:hypothetical protein